MLNILDAQEIATARILPPGAHQFFFRCAQRPAVLALLHDGSVQGRIGSGQTALRFLRPATERDPQEIARLQQTRKPWASSVRGPL